MNLRISTFVAFISLCAPSWAADFSSAPDACPIGNGVTEVSIGGSWINGAHFPYSGLSGNLTELGTLRLRRGIGRDIELSLTGSVRRRLGTQSVSPADGDKFLRPRPRTGETRGVTGDFSIWTQWRFAKPSIQSDLAIKLGLTLPNANVQSGIGLDQGAFHGLVVFSTSVHTLRLSTGGGIAIMPDPTVTVGQDDFYPVFGAIQIPCSRIVSLSVEGLASYANNDGPGDGLIDSLNVGFFAEARVGVFALVAGITEYFESFQPQRGYFIRLTRRFKPPAL